MVPTKIPKILHFFFNKKIPYKKIRVSCHEKLVILPIL
jgi:hypothetical protein